MEKQKFVNSWYKLSFMSMLPLRNIKKKIFEHCGTCERKKRVTAHFYIWLLTQRHIKIPGSPMKAWIDSLPLLWAKTGNKLLEKWKTSPENNIFLWDVHILKVSEISGNMKSWLIYKYFYLKEKYCLKKLKCWWK